MRRRRVLHAAALGIAAWPRALPAQGSAGNKRIAWLGGTTPDPIITRNMIEPFVQGLRDSGFAEGRNLTIDHRWAEGKPDQLPGLLAELLALRPDLIAAVGPAPALAAKTATTTLPIVAAPVDNPVLMGLAQSMARPGGNITGVSGFGIELVARRLQLLKDLVPRGKRFAVLGNPATIDPAELRQALDGFEPKVGAPLSPVLAGGPEQYEAAFAEMKRERVDGVVVLADATLWTNRPRLWELFRANKLPSVWGGKDYLGDVGLASYQSDLAAIMRRAGEIAARILKGANLAEIPFEQATKLILVVSPKAARSLGIEVPAALRKAADEVIE